MPPRKRICSHSSSYFVRLTGNPLCTSFRDDACYRYYLVRVINSLSHFKVELHSYVLLPNEILLLVTPRELRGILSLCNAVSCEYAGYFNKRYAEPWKLRLSRPSYSRVAPGRAFLNCQKFIELAPVRESLVQHPGEYEWSSYCINAFGGHGKFLSCHLSYQALAATPRDRFQVYRQLLSRSFASPYLEELQRILKNGDPVLN